MIFRPLAYIKKFNLKSSFTRVADSDKYSGEIMGKRLAVRLSWNPCLYFLNLKTVTPAFRFVSKKKKELPVDNGFRFSFSLL